MFHLLLFTVIVSNLLGFSLSGIVLDSDTNEPIDNVNIYITGTDNGTTTNYLGKFKLNDIQKHQKGGLSGKPINTKSTILINKFYKLLYYEITS